jgi:hypothetical protein
MRSIKNVNCLGEHMRDLWFGILMSFLSQVALADKEFDFVMIGSSCKMLVSYNVISEESLKIAAADTPVLFCKRNANVITCNVTHTEESHKSEQRTYQLGMDSPPILFFQAENGSESAYINTSENAGSYSSRLLGEKFMGHKVCSTAFFTYDQYKLLSKNN